MPESKLYSKLLPEDLRVTVKADSLGKGSPSGYAHIIGVAFSPRPAVGRMYILEAGDALKEFFGQKAYGYNSFVLYEAFFTVKDADFVEIGHYREEYE